MIFILIIIILLLIIYLYSKNNYESFLSNINNISMNNVFNNNRLLNGQTKFEIYNKNENVINTDFYNANIEFNNYSLQNILNKFINKEKINTSFRS